MANYTINDKTKVIKADIVKLTDRDLTILQKYQLLGYEVINKKSGITVKEMKNNLKKDPETLDKFEKAYKDKDKGFFAACKIYTDWKKKNKQNISIIKRRLHLY